MTQNFSARALTKGLICVSVTVLMLLGALFAAGSASAEPVQEQGSEAVPPAEPVVEQAREAPPVEQVAEAVPPAEPVVEQAKEAPPVEQVKEPAPPVEQVKEVALPVLEPVKEQGKELLTVGEPNKEQLAAGATTPSGPVTGSQAASSPPATEASGVLAASLVVPPTGSGSGEPPTASTAPASLSAVPTPLTAAQRAGELSCQLSGLSGSATDNCTASWLNDQPILTVSPGALVMAAPARASAPTGGGSGGSGGSIGGNRSFIPPPGPAPTGAVGGSAAGGSGVGLSGFFTLAGQLRLAGPRAMRRLRLSSKPWLTAFFVLIPERPG